MCYNKHKLYGTRHLENIKEKLLPLLWSLIFNFRLLDFIWRASLMQHSKSVVTQSIIEKILYSRMIGTDLTWLKIVLNGRWFCARAMLVLLGSHVPCCFTYVLGRLIFVSLKHVYLYTTPDLRGTGVWLFSEK